MKSYDHDLNHLKCLFSCVTCHEYTVSVIFFLLLSMYLILVNEFVIFKFQGSLMQSVNVIGILNQYQVFLTFTAVKSVPTRITSIIAFSVYMVAAIFTITFTHHGAVFSIGPFWAGYNIITRWYTMSTTHITA